MGEVMENRTKWQRIWTTVWLSRVLDCPVHQMAAWYVQGEQTKSRLSVCMCASVCLHSIHPMMLAVLHIGNVLLLLLYIPESQRKISTPFNRLFSAVHQLLKRFSLSFSTHTLFTQLLSSHGFCLHPGSQLLPFMYMCSAAEVLLSQAVLTVLDIHYMVTLFKCVISLRKTKTHASSSSPSLLPGDWIWWTAQWADAWILACVLLCLLNNIVQRPCVEHTVTISMHYVSWLPCTLLHSSFTSFSQIHPVSPLIPCTTNRPCFTCGGKIIIIIKHLTVKGINLAN